MYADAMADRSNRTVYISETLFKAASLLGKKLDRSASRIIEYALAEYLAKNGVKVEFPED